MLVKKVTEDELISLKSMTTGARLKWIREQLQELYKDGYSINQVAKKTGALSPQGLSAIENEKTTNPTYRTINALAEYYRISSEVLFDDYYTTKNKPFQLGDVTLNQNDFPTPIVHKPHTVNCRISITSSSMKLNETMKLTPKQLEALVKRIQFEIELMKEE